MEVVCLILGPTLTPILTTCSTIPTLFAYVLGFDVPTSSFIFIENVLYCKKCYSCIHVHIHVSRKL